MTHAQKPELAGLQLARRFLRRSPSAVTPRRARRKIGIITGIFYPEIGGPATFLSRLRSDLLERGYEVEVVTYGDGPSEPGVSRIPRRLPIPLRLGAFAVSVVLRMSNADVWFVNEYGLVAALLKPVFRKRAAMKVVGDWAWESAVRRRLVQATWDDPADSRDPLVAFEQRRQPFAVEVLKRVRMFGAAAMDRVIVPSRYLGRIVEGWGIPADRITVIHNGVALPSLVHARQSASAPTVVSAGRLVAWKGIDYLLRAFREVLAALPQARLHIYGDGPERTVLESLAGELGFPDGAVTFMGAVSDEVLQVRLTKADVFVLPSAYEGLSHVLLEALAAGCPVIATNIEATREVIREMQEGLLVPYGSSDALAAALQRILTDNGLSAEFARRGRQRVEESFRWEITRDATIAVLALLAEDRAASSRPTSLSQ